MQPVVELIPASNAPAPPSGTRPGWVSGPETFDQRNEIPVLIWGGYQYWTFEYLDNRSAFTIVACDHSGNCKTMGKTRPAVYMERYLTA